MDKFYKIHEDLGRWDVVEINRTMKMAMASCGLDFDRWRATMELKTAAGEFADKSLHHDQNAPNPLKITNGDMNVTTCVAEFTDTASQLFAGSGKRGNIPTDKELTVENAKKPKMLDTELSELAPIFRGTILEDLHKYMQEKFQHPIRIRCQNRGVNGSHQGLYWHKDDPVENRYHIPLWTNPGHILIFSEKPFKWEVGFDPEEAKQAMTFVGHYIPADGQIYEMFTKDYMHAVASVGVGWYQPRWQQTRCHLSFWLAKN
jgi:hypothetical protein